MMVNANLVSRVGLSHRSVCSMDPFAFKATNPHTSGRHGSTLLLLSSCGAIIRSSWPVTELNARGFIGLTGVADTCGSRCRIFRINRSTCTWIVRTDRGLIEDGHHQSDTLGWGWWWSSGLMWLLSRLIHVQVKFDFSWASDCVSQLRNDLLVPLMMLLLFIWSRNTFLSSLHIDNYFTLLGHLIRLLLSIAIYRI